MKAAWYVSEVFDDSFCGIYDQYWFIGCVIFSSIWSTGEIQQALKNVD